MVVLAADTATEVMAAALGAVDAEAGAAEPLCATACCVPKGHSRLLQPVLADLLRRAGREPGDLSAFAVGVGPGSYTGVRIAVSTVKAMALALGLPVFPMSTLWTLAEAAAPGRPARPLRVMPLLYARRQRAYGAVFEKSDASWRRVSPVAVKPVSEWIALFQGCAGPGERLVVHDFDQRTGLLNQVEACGAGRVLHLRGIAGDVGPALLRLAAGGQVTPVCGEDLHRLVPEYVLPVEAEAKLSDRGGAE